MNERRENIEIDLKRLFFSLLRRAWLILLVGILLGTLMFAYSSVAVTKMYCASVEMYVNNTYGVNSPGFSSSQIMAAQDLAKTFMVILKSRDVIKIVAEQSGLDYTAGQIAGMISASSVDETEVFRVTVTCSSYADAVIIANTVASVLPIQASKIVEGCDMRVVEHADPFVKARPVSPNSKRTAMIGFMLGCMLVACGVVANDLMDTRIKSEEFLTAVYEDIPLLAVIPDAENPKSGSGYKGYYEQKKPPVAKNGGGK